MTAVLTLTGAFVWAALGGLFVYLLGEALLAVANSISFHRWAYACAKLHGRAGSLRWSRLPLSLAAQTGALLFHRKGSTRFFNHSEGSEWRGIGDWTAGWVGPK